MAQSTSLDELDNGGSIDDVLNEIDQDMDGGQYGEDYDEMEEQHNQRYRDYQHDMSQMPAQRQAMRPVSTRVEHFQMDWGSYIWRESKQVLLVIALFLLLSWGMVSEMLTKVLPEQVRAYGLGIRAVLAGVLFWAFNNFVLPLI